MRKLLLVVLVALLVGCSTPSTGDVENPNDTVEEPKEPTTVNEVLQSLDYYDTLFDGMEGEVIIEEESLSLKREDQDHPEVVVVEKNGKAEIQMQFKNSHEFEYIKDNKTKKASLSTAYYSNSGKYERVLYCDLVINDGEVQYSFYYDYKRNILYLYDLDYREEIYFVEDLQEKIKETCRHDYLLFDTKYNRMKSAVRVIYNFLERDIEWAKEKEVTVHTFNTSDNNRPIFPYVPNDKQPNVLFETAIANTVFPLYSYLADGIAENLFVVENNGIMGIMFQDGKLVVPYEAINIPTYGDMRDIHYQIVDGKTFNERIILGTQFDTCSFHHGLGHYSYVYLLEKEEFSKEITGHDGPSVFNPLPMNELEDKLNIYSAVHEYTDAEENYTYEYVGKGVFSKDGKVTEAIYDSGLPMNADLAAVQKNGLWGYVDSNGNEVIPCQYQSILTISNYDYPYPALNGSVVVRDTNGYFGVVDYEGNTLIKFNYNWISPFTDGNVLVKTNNEWHIVDPFTQTIIK